MIRQTSLIFSLCLIFAGTSQGAGFRLPEVTVSGVAASSAIVADTDNAEALPYNPAISSFVESDTIAAGLSQIRSDYSVTPDGGVQTDALKENSAAIPSIIYIKKMSDSMDFALNVISPFGLETEWPDNTFPAFGGIDAIEPALTGLEMMNINPNLVYRVNDNLGIALGLDYYAVRNADFNTQAININGDGNDYGWNVALAGDYGPVSIGVAYRSSVDVDIDGTFDYVGIMQTTARTSVEFPALLQLGVRYEINSAWEVEFDFDREYWKSFDRIVIQDANTGNVLSESRFNWDNVNTYRLSASYNITDSSEARFGAGVAESPLSGGSFFSPATPTAKRKFMSAGYQKNFESVSVGFGYLYVVADDDVSNTSIPYLGWDANGTAAYNGRYAFEAHEFAIGIQKKF